MSGVQLVGLEGTHLARIRSWLHDRDLRERVGTLLAPSEREHEAWYERVTSDSARVTFVVLSNSEAVGLCGLSGIDLVHRRAEVWLYIASDRRSGLGRHALDEVLMYAFDDLGLHRVDARVFAYNDIATAFFESSGFRREGHDRDGVFRRGMFHDVIRFALLASERDQH